MCTRIIFKLHFKFFYLVLYKKPNIEGMTLSLGLKQYVGRGARKKEGLNYFPESKTVATAV